VHLVTMMQKMIVVWYAMQCSVSHTFYCGRRGGGGDGLQYGLFMCWWHVQADVNKEGRIVEGIATV